MDRSEDRGGTSDVIYDIDVARRLVRIQVRRNVPRDQAVEVYRRLFSAPAYQPGFSLVVDRRGLREPPSADVVRAVVEYLRERLDQTGACRMAIVTDEDAPHSAWRSAEMLAGHYTSVELRVFDDLESAEHWATSAPTGPPPRA